MKTSGFDSDISLRSLNRERLIEIEHFVNAYKSQLDEIKLAVNGTIYAKLDPFIFTPGHRSVLLQIPNALEQNKRKCYVAASVAKNVAVESTPIPRPIHSEEEQLETESKYKALLIAKLKKFLDKQKIQLDLKDENIIDFCLENNQYKCKVQCPSCDRVIPGIFNKHWAISNIEKHLKTHAVDTVNPDENDVNGVNVEEPNHTNTILAINENQMAFIIEEVL